MCEKEAEELRYILKDENDKEIGKGNLTGKESGKVTLAIETKKVEETTTYTYTLEIEFVETNKDQNHNMNAEFNGEVDVQLTEKTIPAKTTLAQLAALNPALTSKGNEAHFDGTSCNETCVNPKTSGACTSGCNYQENGLYEAPDENGTTSYYFRGTVENNYVKFGKTNSEKWFKNSTYNNYKYYLNQQECESDTDYSINACTKLYESNADMWWRIIRINGDGSIRMIYAGTSTSGNVPEQTGTGTMIGSYPFNNSNDQAEYVGYQYTHTPDAPVRNGHDEDSIAKTELEKWFKENLLDEYNDGYIDKNAGFCGDRSITTGTGIGDEYTEYGPYTRIEGTDKPTFLCEDKANDLYTIKGAGEGTHSLTYPIGLSTVDEQVYAGDYWARINNKYYLYNDGDYWLMSPRFFFFGVGWNYSTGPGGLGSYYINEAFGFRPVINLTANSLTLGKGTADDPFRVE